MTVRKRPGKETVERLTEGPAPCNRARLGARSRDPGHMVPCVDVCDVFQMSNYKRATLDEDEVSEAPAEAAASPDSLEVSHLTHLLAT